MYIKEINKTIKPIVDEFKNILKRDWISGANDNSFGNVGITFEREIGKSPDSMYFPDFYWINFCSYSSRTTVYQMEGYLSILPQDCHKLLNPLQEVQLQ